MSWLGHWISPREHEEIVGDLKAKIARLEAEYVDLAQCLMSETQARRTAERVREGLRAHYTGKSGGAEVVYLDAIRARIRETAT